MSESACCEGAAEEEEFELSGCYCLRCPACVTEEEREKRLCEEHFLEEGEKENAG